MCSLNTEIFTENLTQYTIEEGVCLRVILNNELCVLGKVVVVSPSFTTFHLSPHIQ